MVESTPVEFTGERLVPGLVDVNLWNEHFSRYEFAALFARDKRVLDAGCGTGYGAAHLARTARSVIGIDISDDAIAYAREHYPDVRFEGAPADKVPLTDASVDLVTAFEVIEHLADWRALLDECRRVLAPDGMALVSTPNRVYYAESRRLSGPNPFHTHEFDFDEFERELRSVFPHVNLFAQNHAESIVFAPFASACAVHALVEHREPEPLDSHFFVALCGAGPLPQPGSFVFVPAGANALLERERHIALLEGEVRLKTEWLQTSNAELNALHTEHERQRVEMEARNRWAESLNRELSERGQRIVELQTESEQAHAAFQTKLDELEMDIQAKTRWALETERRLTAENEHIQQELQKCVELLHAAERTVEERTHWAQRAQSQAEENARRLNAAKVSRWIRLGRKLGLGPVLE